MFFGAKVFSKSFSPLLGVVLVGCNATDAYDPMPFVSDSGGVDGAGGCSCSCNCNCKKTTVASGSGASQGSARGGVGNTSAANGSTSTSMGNRSTNSNGGSAAVLGANSTSARSAGGARNVGGSTSSARSTGGARSVGSSASSANSGGGVRSTGGSSSTGGRSVCTDEPRSSESCKDAISWGFCGQDWFAGNCDASCGVCSMGSSSTATGGARAAGGAATATGRANATGGAAAIGNPAGGARAAGGAAATGGGATGGAAPASTTAPGVTAAACSEAQKTLSSNASGTHCGYTYEYWKDTGSGSLVLKADGFSVDWSNINNLLGRKGLRPGSKNNIVTYEANYQPNGNSYLCVYGWTKGPLVEYYIVDSWGTWRPPGGQGLMGTVTCDGATYDIYKTQRVNQPSIEGNTTFSQYFSVRQQKRTSGTITVGCHFDAWVSKGMSMGSLYEVSMTVEGYQSSGKADVKMSMK